MSDKKPTIVIVGSDIDKWKQRQCRLYRQDKIKPVIHFIDPLVKKDDELLTLLENKRNYIYGHLYGMDNKRLQSFLAKELDAGVLSGKEEQLEHLEKLRKKLAKRWKKRKE